MAKINHNNFIDTVDDVFQSAKKEGALHLYAQDKKLTGKTLRIDGRDLLHFGTTGYLGLEQDRRLKAAAIKAIEAYGTQFPLSKSYISHPLYAELEHKLKQMYGIEPIITKNSTLGHLGVIPTLIRDEDAVILDHQVHWSVQSACQQLKLRGIPVLMIRHSNLDMLEQTIRKLMGKVKKIYYMVDGVYSMYGDYAPVNELLALTEKYPQLQLYVDDVHGMSWKGNNGTGFIFEALGWLPENVHVVSTLSKTFGASGATYFTSNASLRDKIKTFGGPLTFSAQLEPASVAAAIASADIHLSPEISHMQQSLSEKITLFNNLLNDSVIPLVSKNDSPVFFLAMGTPTTGYNFTRRLFDEGFYLNLGIYPAVPIRNTGIRITLSKHNSKDDIKALSEALLFHYEKAVEETGSSDSGIRKSFGLPIRTKITLPEETLELEFEEKSSIKDISETEWNNYLADRNIFDWKGMEYLENCFVNNPDPTHKFEFYYFTIRDENGLPVLMTFFTYGMWKDDMMSPESVSVQLEKIRVGDPLHMTSMVLNMGSIFTEGNHLYIDESHPQVYDALRLLLKRVQQKFELLNADLIVLRDFDPRNNFGGLIKEQGYFQMDMPDSCTLSLNKDITPENYPASLSARSQRHFKQDIAPYIDRYDVVIKDRLDSQETVAVHELYKNVHSRNIALNTFCYPLNVFETMVSHDNWEFILLYLNTSEGRSLVGVMFCYKNAGGCYVPELIGMDYDYSRDHGLYRQLLYQTILRAKVLNLKRIDFGVTATFEKKKLGADCHQKIAFVQARDNFKLELLQTMQNDNS